MSARDRLIDTARELFVLNGISNVGINTVTDAAGVARMTLYNNFKSKEELVAAVFEREAELRRQSIRVTQEVLEGPFERVLALFVVALELATLEGFRGCAFINLAVEAATPDSQLHRLAQRHKKWIVDNIRLQLALGDFADSDELADQIAVLWDGGIVGAYVHQSNRPIKAARDAARSLLRSAAK
jgi:AcrR family transcriptional regulator